MKVTVFSTKGASNIEVEVDDSVETWGELIPLLEAKGVVTEEMRAVCAENKQTFTCPTAQLQPQDGKLTIFLQAKKVRNGSRWNSEIKA